MNVQATKWLLVATGLTLADCEAGLSNVLEKSARGDELRTETTVGVTLPADCPTLTAALQAGTSSLTVS